ncbi:hypothetical protein [Moraxella lacunata]|uniref:hypothetical protein n=1 Tax=Moraxella lacunata TaxID=477 RepID=UPI003EDEA16C
MTKSKFNKINGKQWVKIKRLILPQFCLFCQNHHANLCPNLLLNKSHKFEQVFENML